MNTIRTPSAIGRGLLSPILAVGALATGACQPVPEPGSVDLVSDSIGVQATNGDPVEGFDDYEHYLWFGFTAADVLPWVQDQVANSRPETLIVALGINDAAPRNGGWDWDDVSVWLDLLDAPHPDACVVVVLPAVGDGASAELDREVGKARHGIGTLADMREGPTVEVDWAAAVTADPTVLGPDGAHLATDADGVAPHAADAMTDLYRDGADQCPQ